jgi:hypothetical protein
MSRPQSIESLIQKVENTANIDQSTYEHFNLLFPASKGIMAINELSYVRRLKNSLREKKGDINEQYFSLRHYYFSSEHYQDICEAFSSNGKEVKNPIELSKIAIQKLLKEPISYWKLLGDLNKEEKLLIKMLVRIHSLYPRI